MTFFGTVLSRSVLELIRSYIRKKTTRLSDESYNLLVTEKACGDFKEEFILNELKEIYFYNRTGIRTNANSIKKYISFKNKLGKNFTWQDMNQVKMYFTFEKNEIKIKLDRWNIIINKVISVLAIFILLFGLFFPVFFNLHELLNIKNHFIYPLVYLIPFFLSIILLVSTIPISIAKRMKKIQNLQ